MEHYQTMFPGTQIEIQQNYFPSMGDILQSNSFHPKNSRLNQFAFQAFMLFPYNFILPAHCQQCNEKGMPRYHVAKIS